MLLTCSVPPPMPAASTCASFAYAYGPTCSEKNSNDSLASRVTAANPLSESCGNTQNDSGTPRTLAPCFTTKRATPSEYSQGEIGTSCFQCVRRSPPGRSTCSTITPFDTTWYSAFVVTINSPVALSPMWSIDGIHCRARLYQFSLNAVRSPWMLLIKRSPFAGTP